jgi:hypothetical protein
MALHQPRGASSTATSRSTDCAASTSRLSPAAWGFKYCDRGKMYYLILSFLTSLPICYADRHLASGAKEAQLQTIARAVSQTARDAPEAALALTVAWHESRLCTAVHSGVAGGRGRGLWQIEPGSHLPKPYEGLSEEATLSASRSAISLLRRSYQCGPGVADRLTAYAGRPCGKSWPTLSDRVRFYWWALSRIRGGK